MRSLSLSNGVLLASAVVTLTAGLFCQEEQPKPKKPQQVEKATLHLWDVRCLCMTPKEAEPVMMWIRAVAGETVAPKMDRNGFLLVRVTRRQVEKVSDLMDWLHAYQPLRFKVEIQELRGPADDLTALQKAAGQVLRTFEAHTALLLRASKRKNVTLKNHAPRSLTGIALAAIDKGDGQDKKDKKEKKDEKAGEAASPVLRIGALPYKNDGFRVRTWSPDSALVTMKQGQTLVLTDEKRGRLLLIRFTEVKATRRPDPFDGPAGRDK